MIKKPVAIIVGLLLLLGGLFRCDAFSAEVPSTPSNVIRQWLHFYPKNLLQAVTLTSPDFRGNFPPTEWISQKKLLLRQIRLQYLDSETLKREISGNYAVMEVKVLISTILGEQVQIVRYELGPYCST